jgi:hypothetical protein
MGREPLGPWELAAPEAQPLGVFINRRQQKINRLPAKVSSINHRMA